MGILVGGIGAGVFWGAQLLWPPIIAILAAMAAVARATGAFHEDGLADTFDGFGGGWTTETILSIMKDSRIGTYGVVALVLVLAAKVTALASLDPMSVVWALIAGHVLGRWSSLPLIWQYEYVRDESSTGKPFAATVTPGRLAVGTILAFGVVALVLRGQAVPVLIGTLLVTALSGLFFRRQIGGITGDTLGAANQLVELSTYLALAADLPLM